MVPRMHLDRLDPQPAALGRTGCTSGADPPAKRPASSPPVPARISTMASRSSCGIGRDQQLLQLGAQRRDLAGEAVARRPGPLPPSRDRRPAAISSAPARARASRRANDSAARTIGASRACSRPRDFSLAGSASSGRVGELPRDLLRPRERLAEAAVHGLTRLAAGPCGCRGTCGGTDPRARRCRSGAACR